MASDLIQFKKIADEITIRESDGVGVVSVRGAARLAGVSAEAISKAFKSVNQTPSKLAKNLIEQGFDGVNLLAMLETGITDEAMAVIAHYYAYAASRFCTSQAKHTAKQFEKLGARAAFYAFKGLILGQQPPQQLNEPKPKLPPTAALQVQPKPQPTLTVTSAVDAAKQMSGFVLELLNDLEIGQTPKQDKSLKIGVAISAAQIYCPEIADALNPAQKLLAATTATDGVYLTPTTLGERLGGISARTVNKQLRDMGLQVKNENPPKGDPAWLPTEAGKPYSMMTIATGQHGDTTSYQHLKWSERVLELFEGGVAA